MRKSIDGATKSTTRESQGHKTSAAKPSFKKLIATNGNGDGIPAYRRIQRAIRNQIESGQLQPGQAVDSERELARIHEVSLMTARHALAELQREGLVERHRGSGTFVAPPRIEFNKLTSFTEQMSGRSMSAQSRVLHLSTIQGEHDIAVRLALPATSRLLVIERLREAGGEPFALEMSYLPADDYGRITKAQLERGSLFVLLERDYGTKIAYADEDVDSTVAEPKTAAFLRVPSGAPLLRIRQTIFSAEGKAMLYVLGLYRSDRHILHIRRFR